MESHATDISRFSVSDLNGNYVNSGDDNYNTLWNILTNFKSSKRDTFDISEKAVINLRFESEDKLVITAFENDRLLRKVEIKGKMKGDYFSIRRKLFLIPIPFLYFHQETKGIIGKAQNSDMIVKYADFNAGWILVFAAGGLNGYYENTYAKLD
jgi:hypothetical protein